MEKIANYEKLLEGHIMPAHIYHRETSSFTFRTVCMQLAYSYRMCECAFEHEYFDYVSHNVEINNIMLDKIKHSLRYGECPLVRGVDERCIKETGIRAWHITCVVGSDKTVKDFISDIDPFLEFVYENRTFIFKLTPYDLAFLRDKHTIIDFFISRTGHEIYASGLLSAERMNTNHIQFESYFLPCYCMVKQNMKLFQLALSSWHRYNKNDTIKALCMALKSDRLEMGDILIKFIKSTYELTGSLRFALRAAHDVRILYEGGP